MTEALSVECLQGSSMAQRPNALIAGAVKTH